VSALQITGVYMAGYLGWMLLSGDFTYKGSVQYLWLFAGSGLLTLLAFPLIYFSEKIFGLLSDVTLLELSDTNHPLLRELAEKAPGTFQHSLQVANLAESAAAETGGNTLMVRVGAMFHDVGKLKRPLYFVENQSTGHNPHQDLSFGESARIIIDHVKEGIVLARQYNLPDRVVDFIRTHHGTSTVQYFYRKYLQSFPDDRKALERFTYPGPQPFTLETALVMMADSIEAAARSLDQPTPEHLDALVESIVNRQLQEGQFQNAPVTLKDLQRAKRVFKKKLAGMYHHRVAYPEAREKLD
jgi:putative nucleotidyltransferase with HDIG domain